MVREESHHSNEEGREDDEANDVGAAPVFQRTLELVLVRINLRQPK